jgi:hypothetical protein
MDNLKKWKLQPRVKKNSKKLETSEGGRRRNKNVI